MKARPRRSTSQAGFSLIELLVVTVVLGIVVSIAIVALFNALDRAKQRATMADMRSVGRAIEAYEVDYGFLPDDAGGIVSLKPILTPYQISALPVDDHWSNPFTYLADSSDYTLESHGKDGVDGGNISYATRHDFNLDIVLSNGAFIAAPD